MDTHTHTRTHAHTHTRAHTHTHTLPPAHVHAHTHTHTHITHVLKTHLLFRALVNPKCVEILLSAGKMLMKFDPFLNKPVKKYFVLHAFRIKNYIELN